MTGRQFAPLPVLLIVVTLLAAQQQVAVAQAPGGDLGENIKEARNVQPFANQIQSFVRAQVKALGGNDPAAQSQARESLARQVLPPAAGGDPPTQAFLDYYATLVNEELMKLTQSNDTRIRLNVAIVAAKVAGGAKNAKLLPVTQALLKDPADAVTLWALRAAANILPASIAGGSDQLTPAIVQLGQTRPTVIAEVYEALAVEGANAKTLSVVVPALHTVLQSRIAQYNSTVPRHPSAETRAAVYLTARNEYLAQATDQKVMTARLLSDLLGVVAQRAADASSEQRRELVVLIRGVSGAMVVIGQWEGSTPLQAAARPGASLPIGARPEDLRNVVQPIHPALTGIPKFSKIPLPPKVGEMTVAEEDPGTPPPATASTAPSGGR